MGIFALIAPLIPQLVTFAEKFFGPKNGSSKLDTVVKQVQVLIDNLGLVGKLPNTPPATADIVNTVSQVAGQLYPSGTTYVPVPAHDSAGQQVTINLPDKDALKKLILWGLS